MRKKKNKARKTKMELSSAVSVSLLVSKQKPRILALVSTKQDDFVLVVQLISTTDKFTLKTTFEKKSAFPMTQYEKIPNLEILGVLGLFSWENDVLFSVVTSASQVAVIENSPIFRVSQVRFNVPGTSLYFLLLEYCRSSLFYAMPSASPYLIHMSSGAFSRGCVGLLLMPVSVIKTRFESSLYQYPSVWGAFRDILAKEGFKGLFVGFGVTSLRDIPFAGIYLMCYEYSKKRFMEPSMPAWLNKSASAIVAGTIATIITQPFDLIKTKIQIAPSKYPNFLIVFKSLAQLESIKVFFTGLGPRLVRKPLHAAITWTVYEESLRIFKKV
ncbi:hypothetical protein HMI54_015222 [Coelomomyces lativittatus]|nr:hypothetical protein HMI54_015222 [Coelomomyces lativittatus]